MALNENASPAGDDEIVFANEAKPETGEAIRAPWKILVVDDENDVHGLTQMVLSDFTFDGRGIKLYDAYSAAEARQLLKSNPDTALILLDVVMEDDHSGLQLVQHIRRELGNDCVRIILRTGQPGQAPESKVIIEYDINDYKEKSELTSQKLLTAMIVSLRTYNAITEIATLNAELESKVAMRTQELNEANLRLQSSIARLEEDEEAGKKIQFRLLPDPEKHLGPYTFNRFLRPSMYLSGDFVDYFEVDDERIAFYMADVSGHGVASAFVTVLIKSFMSRHLEQYHRGQNNAIVDPARLLAALNQTLLDDNLGKHATIFYGLLTPGAGTLHFTNGGHYPYPVLSQGGTSTWLEERSPAVGLFDFSTFTTCCLPVQPDLRLTLLSDGVLDILPQLQLADKTEQLFHLCRGRGEGILDLLTALDTNGQENLPDDITVLTIDTEAKTS